MPSRTSSLKHTHKYYLLEQTGLWHCALCSHYMPGNMPPPVWKKSYCWSCNTVIELTPDNMRKTHPLCDKCTANLQIVNDADEILEKQLYEARMKKLGKLYPQTEQVVEKEDEIEDIPAHAPECSVFESGVCTCGVE